MSSSSKSAKKAKTFLTEKGVAKRAKALHSFITLATDDEAQRFHQENQEAILTVLTERFGDLEATAKKGKATISDFIPIFNCLKALIRFVPSILSQPKSIQPIQKVLERSLAKSNRHQFRQLAVEFLLQLIDALETTNPALKEFSSLFGSAVNFGPLFDDTSVDKQAVLAAAGPPSSEETVQMWELVLDSMNQKKFGFWYDLLRNEYLSIMFPESGKQNKDAKVWSDVPEPVLRILANKFGNWFLSKNISSVLWSEENYPVMLNSMAKVFSLSIQYHSTLKKAIDAYWTYFATSKSTTTSKIYVIQTKAFIKNLAEVFKRKTGPELVAVQVALCNDALSIYQTLSFRLAQDPEKETWEFLQFTVLDVAFQQFRSSNPFALDTAVPQMAVNLASTLFLVWLRSPQTSEMMWKNFAVQISSLVNWNAIVNAWATLVHRLTVMLVDQLYPKPAVEVTKNPSRSKLETSPDDDEEGSKKKKEKPGQDSGGASKPAPPTIELFPLPLDSPALKQRWFTMLNLLGNPCQIGEPDNFAEALKCLSDIVDLVTQAENHMELYAQPPLQICNNILPWLLEACTVEGKKNRGRLIAYSALCKLFCRFRMVHASPELHAHFYRTLQSGLKQAHSSLTWAVLRKATSVFGFGFPGVTVLIPEFLSEISQMLRPDKSPPPDDVQYKSLKVLSSLICYPNHYRAWKAESAHSGLVLSSDDIKNQSITTLLLCLAHESLAPAVKATCLRSLTVTLFEELHFYTRKDSLAPMLKAISVGSLSLSKPILDSSLECFSSLAAVCNLWQQVDPSFVSQIITTLANNITTWLERKNNPMRDEAVSSLYFCLLEWLTTTTVNVFADTTLAEVVFTALVAGLYEGGTITPSDQGKEGPSKKKGFFTKSGAPGSSNSLQNASSSNLSTQNSTASPSGSPAQDHSAGAGSGSKIKDAAEIVLATIFNSYNQFPTLAGCEQITSWTGDVDQEASGSIYFLYNSQSIIGFKQIPGEKGGVVVQLTVRDCTGKYTWESSLLYTQRIDEGQPVDPVIKEATSSSNEKPAAEVVNEQDPLLQTLESLRTLAPEIQPLSSSLYTEVYIPTMNDRITELQKTVEQQSKEETIATEKRKADKQQRASLPLKPVRTEEPSASFHYVRLLLSHFGFLNPASRQRLLLLETSDSRMLRGIRELDRMFGREAIKVGIVYVKEGQEIQNEILANETCSQDYADFCAGLGWTVDLATHEGFMGGLDKTSFTAGRTAPYFANALVEIIFHELTNMPSNPADPQKIARKRHIANDSVNIIWSEHKKDYRVDTIVTQFNDALIIIYPLPNGLYRIQIHQKEKVPPFGPLQDGMVVNKQLLPILVRLTAINANRAARSTIEGYKKPLTARLNIIKEIAQRCGSDLKFEDFYSRFFQHFEPNQLAVPSSSSASSAASSSPATASASPSASPSPTSTSSLSPSSSSTETASTPLSSVSSPRGFSPAVIPSSVSSATSSASSSTSASSSSPSSSSFSPSSSSESEKGGSSPTTTTPGSQPTSQVKWSIGNRGRIGERPQPKK